jgi:nitrogen fixation/metabolism regulation signal transduction histidine kinase
MTVHLGILALMVAVTGGAFIRLRRGRQTADALLVALALTTAGLEGVLLFGERGFGLPWEGAARRELTARVERIVEFLRAEGAAALEQVRAVGADPDTRALLGEDDVVSRKARRPVFLDLQERFPEGAPSGVTVYDERGAPRAWSGWSPPSTMLLAREPDPAAETVGIREGNIYTLLEVVHPVAGPAGQTVGYVAYQRPLRVQYPLESRLFRVDDALKHLEGGGGARASVALVLHQSASTDVRSLEAGPLKLDIRRDAASCSATITSSAGESVGRVSLAGLSRSAWWTSRLAPLARARTVLLALVAALVALRLWSGAAALPGPAASFARLGLVGAGRLALYAILPRAGVDPLGVLDPAYFASIRLHGLLRSPGDVLLSAGALFLATRELRRLAIAAEPRLKDFGRRQAALAALPGLVGALLVGSVVVRHWNQVADIARNVNLPLYDRFDPFSSAPGAALEAALLGFGVAFLLLGDALLRGSRALFTRLPAGTSMAVVMGTAWLVAALKAKTGVGTTPADDFLRPLPALVALGAFHRWGRVPGAGAALGAALLAALANLPPLADGDDTRRREQVELFAVDHMESPSNSRRFLIEQIANHLAESLPLQEALRDRTGKENADLAFILWARSPLTTFPAGSFLRLRDAAGAIVSEFSLGYPPELVPAAAPADASRDARFSREEVGPERVDVYAVRVPVTSAARTVGTVELSLAWFDELGRPEEAPRAAAGLLANLTAPPPTTGFLRRVPERIDRYRGDRLVSSTDLEEGLLSRVPPTVVEALADPSVEGRWETRRVGRKVYDLYCVRERDGDRTVGYLTFGVERHGKRHVLWMLVRSALVTLVLTVVFLGVIALLARTAPADATVRRFRLPSLGFRERVIGGFLLVSLLPTVLLGVLGQRLFVDQKREQFRSGLEEDLRVSRELIGRQLVDAARNAAASEEVRSLLEPPAGAYRTLSAPASVDGIAVFSGDGMLRGASRSASVDLALLPASVQTSESPVEFFRRKGADLVACAVVPVTGLAQGRAPGRVLAFQKVGARLAADLERRVGSPVGFFVGGRLHATSKPELYRSEILSDLVDPTAYLKIELEGRQRWSQSSRAGATSMLASYGPLRDEEGRAVGILAALTPHSGGLGPDVAAVLSKIYFLCLLVFAGAILGALVLANRLTRPISELTQGAERIRAGRLGERIASRATGEIGRLVRSFNLMSERLAESEARDRERREYIEAIIRHVGSGVVSFDAAGRVATVNEAAARVLAVDPEAIVGEEASSIRGNAALRAILQAVRPVLHGRREEVVCELEISGAPESEAEPRAIRLVATPLADREGRAQGAVAVFEDLTELIRSKKITAWAEMARQVAHEIKNPLTPMKLSAQHLRQAWRDRHPKFGQILEESTETIVDRCEALRRIAIEFSDYARMPGRRVRREELGRLLREAQRLYGDAGGRRVDFRLEVPRDEIFTRVDKDEVMRLFINLIENSIQAMPHGGDLEVRARRDNGAAFVTIHDTGVGIPPENLPRIFEPSFSTKTGGAGLGLPICKAIMEDYGGAISIASVEGKGTTVTLTFPVDDSRANGEPEAAD